MSTLDINMQTLMFVGYASQGNTQKAMTSREDYIKKKYNTPKRTPRRSMPKIITEENTLN